MTPNIVDLIQEENMLKGEDLQYVAIVLQADTKITIIIRKNHVKTVQMVGFKIWSSKLPAGSVPVAIFKIQ